MSEVLAALSVVLDAAERRPPGFAVRSAYLAGRIAAELGLPEERRADLVLAALVIDVGTTGPITDGIHDRRVAARRATAARDTRRCRSTCRARPARRQRSPRSGSRQASPAPSSRAASAGMDVARPGPAATSSPRTGACSRSPRSWRRWVMRRHPPTWIAPCAPSADGRSTRGSWTSCWVSGERACGPSSPTRAFRPPCWHSNPGTASAGCTTTASTPSR